MKDDLAAAGVAAASVRQRCPVQTVVSQDEQPHPHPLLQPKAHKSWQCSAGRHGLWAEVGKQNTQCLVLCPHSQPSRGETVIPILWLRKQRLQEGTWLAQSHAAQRNLRWISWFWYLFSFCPPICLSRYRLTSLLHSPKVLAGNVDTTPSPSPSLWSQAKWDVCLLAGELIPRTFSSLRICCPAPWTDIQRVINHTIGCPPTGNTWPQVFFSNVPEKVKKSY